MEVDGPLSFSNLEDSQQQTSLQRLKSLDNEDRSLRDKLHDVADILGLPTGILLTDAPNLDGNKSRHHHHARLEWVLRWLLNIIQSYKEHGQM